MLQEELHSHVVAVGIYIFAVGEVERQHDWLRRTRCNGSHAVVWIVGDVAAPHVEAVANEHDADVNIVEWSKVVLVLHEHTHHGQLLAAG